MGKSIKISSDMSKKVTPAEKDIRQSLMEQLQTKGRLNSVFIDLVNDYVSHWKVKKGLIEDIKLKGVRYMTTNGNGYDVEKANESIANLQKETAVMLKILADLDLKTPTQVTETDSTDGYC